MGKDKTGKLDVMLNVNDSELKTPKHDELCLWVNNNIKNILYSLLSNKYSNELTQFLGTNNDKTKTIFQLDWEEPLKSYNGFVVGIPDFRYSIFHSEKVIYDEGKVDTARFLFGGYIEVKPIIKSLGETMRQIKLYRSYFIGATGLPLREKEYSFKWHNAEMNRYDFFIVTNTEEYKQIFESQDIFYVTPKGNRHLKNLIDKGGVK